MLLAVPNWYNRAHNGLKLEKNHAEVSLGDVKLSHRKKPLDRDRHERSPGEVPFHFQDVPKKAQDRIAERLSLKEAREGTTSRPQEEHISCHWSRKKLQNNIED